MALVTGTPVLARREGNEVSITISLGDTSQILTFKCENDKDAFHCFDMWETIVYDAIEYPVNSEEAIYDEDEDEE
jgi:hypothetical protein